MPDSGYNDTKLLAHFLADRDALCPSCSYNLRDLTGPACPECGLELALHLGLADARTARYNTAMIALAITGGSFAVFLLFMVTIWCFDGMPGPSDFRLWALVYPTIISVPHLGALAFLLSRRGRRWFRSIPSAVCTWGTILGIAVAAASIIAWIAWFWIVNF